VATFAVILPAAGKSSRFHDAFYKKPFVPLENRAVWLYSAERFLAREDVKQVMIVVSPEDREEFHSKFGANVAILGVEVVDGGEQRWQSVRNGLARVKPTVDFVAVHDAARPCLAEEWIDGVFTAAETSGAAILATPIHGTVKRVDERNSVTETVPRGGLWEAQTPQVFRRELLMEAYAKLEGKLDGKGAPGESVTDDAQAVERLGHSVSVVMGSPLNIKITTKADLRFAAAALKALPKPKLMGPAHPFADGDIWR